MPVALQPAPCISKAWARHGSCRSSDVIVPAASSRSWLWRKTAVPTIVCASSDNSRRTVKITRPKQQPKQVQHRSGQGSLNQQRLSLQRSKGSTVADGRSRISQSSSIDSSLDSLDAEERPPGRFTAWWEGLPLRYRVVLATMMAEILCQLDKVNMSVAIIPMAREFGWGSTVSGLVQSSFFWGYLLCQIPAGYVSSRVGGRTVLPVGVGLQSVATATLPLLASTVPGLCISRALVGLGEASAPSAAIDIVSRLVPKEERARAIAFVFSGLHVGSILGLLLGPYIITKLGWQAVFYIFGGAGLLWVLWFERTIRRAEANDPETAALMQGSNGSSAGAATTPVPWRAFLRNPPLRALMATHFCNQWFHYTFGAWLPTYLADTLSLDLTRAAQTALLPPLAAIAASAVAGQLADGLIAKGWKVGLVRKMAQTLAFLGPAACLAVAATTEDSITTVAAITAALGLSNFALAGLYCTHGDMSPKYSSLMLALTKTPAAVPGIVGVPFVGLLYEQTQSWELALMAPSIVCMLIGAVIYITLCRNDPVDFDAADNQPFAIEALWSRGTAGRVQGKDD